MSPGAPAEDLLQIYEIALTKDAQFRSAGAANRAAQEITPQARAGLLPSVTAGVNAAGNETNVKKSGLATAIGRSNFNTTDYGIALTQPLYRRDRWIALNQAESRVDAADTDYEFARQDLILRVALRYFNVLRATDTLTFARAEQEAFGQQLEQSQQRFEVGLIAITDVEEAKAGSDLARSRVIQAENDLYNAREALREVTGAYHERLAILGQGMPLEMPEPNDVQAWTERALQENLQIRSQVFNTNTSKLEIERAEAGHLPTLDLVGSHYRYKSTGGTSVGSRSTYWSSQIGVELTVPIYAGGSVLSRTRESRSLYDKSLDDLEGTRRSVHRQTHDAFLGIESGIAQVSALEQAVKSVRSALEAIEAGFQVGTRTTVDVLNAQRNLFDAKRNLADARYSYVVNTLALKQASGSLSEEDVRLVNSWLEPAPAD